jgi:PAS domain S-box-containing protein
MLWLYLLGAVTFLIIVLRRVLRRQEPLNDELYSKNVAVEHVHSGVAWVRGDSTIGSVNPSLAGIFNQAPRDLIGRHWLMLFEDRDRPRAQEAQAQTLLAGMTSFDARGARPGGSPAWINVRLVAVHDHRMRFAGHHCLIEDRTRLHELERQVEQGTPFECLEAHR